MRRVPAPTASLISDCMLPPLPAAMPVNRKPRGGTRLSGSAGGLYHSPTHMAKPVTRVIGQVDAISGMAGADQAVEHACFAPPLEQLPVGPERTAMRRAAAPAG